MFDGSQQNLKLECFIDSDYTGDLNRRRSIIGYLFNYGGGLVSMKATLQYIVALSTTMAEYIVATKIVKEELWLKGLTCELGFQ